MLARIDRHDDVIVVDWSRLIIVAFLEVRIARKRRRCEAEIDEKCLHRRVMVTKNACVVDDFPQRPSTWPSFRLTRHNSNVSLPGLDVTRRGRGRTTQRKD